MRRLVLIAEVSKGGKIVLPRGRVKKLPSGE